METKPCVHIVHTSETTQDERTRTRLQTATATAGPAKKCPLPTISIDRRALVAGEIRYDRATDESRDAGVGKHQLQLGKND